jgi:hypothetical protein
VVATDDQRVAHAVEDALAFVIHEARASVQQFGRAVDRRAVRLAEGLVAEADPEHRDASLAAVADDLDAVPGVARMSRTR